MALGASRFDVLRLVLRQGMMLVAIGVAFGLAISLLVGRAFSRMLFGLSSADPLSLLGASAVLPTGHFGDLQAGIEQHLRKPGECEAHDADPFGSAATPML